MLMSAGAPRPEEPSTGEMVPHVDTPGPQERRLSLIRWVLAALTLSMVLALAWEMVQGPFGAVDMLELTLALGLTVLLLAHQHVTQNVASRRTSRDTSLTRILQGLSRSVSPESVVDAIVAELGATSGADHVVVARVRRPDDVVEVTLVSVGVAVPPSMTYLRPDIAGAVAGYSDGALSPRGRLAPRAQLRVAADEIARRVHSGYGLSNVLTVPLAHERRFLGALILSKRTRTTWSAEDRRLLDWAGSEVSAAFGRAYAHEEAERAAHLDPLTGLPNRRYFDELVGILRPGRRSGDRTSIVMIDADHFKKVNDRHGHVTGDRVLKAIGTAIAASVRTEDTPARFGGEEFVVLVRRATAQQAADVGERIRAAVAALPTMALGLDGPVTVSVGVAVARDDEEVRSLVERADTALYLAKRHGRDRVEIA